MKTAIVANFPVGPKFNGGAMTVWGLVNALIEKGDQIYLILLCEKNTEKKIYTECINILAQYNIKFEIIYFEEKKKNIFKKIKNFLISFFLKSPDYFFYEQKKLNKELKKIFSREKFERIFCYHFDALSACYTENKENIVCCLGDLIHEPRNNRRLILNNSLYSRIINYLEEKISNKIIKNMLHGFDKKGFYANHYYEKTKLQIKQTNYFRTSIIRPKNKVKYLEKNEKISRVILIGDLSGTVTISSLYFLKDFLKYSNSSIINYFKFEIFGRGNLHRSLNDLKKIESVIFKGESNNLSNEFNNSCVLLACNTIDVGIRVRIITALSHGIVVITHSSNLKGIPELEHNKNALIFNNGNELSNILIKIKNNEIKLRKISDEAIITFEKYFYFSNAFKNLENKIFK